MLTNVIPHQHHYKFFKKKILITFFVLCLKVNTFICITNSKNFTFGPLYFLKVSFIYMDIQIIRRTKKKKKKGKKMIWLYKLTLLRLIQHNRGASLHCLIIIHLHIMKNWQNIPNNIYTDYPCTVVNPYKYAKIDHNVQQVNPHRCARESRL